MNIGDAIKAMKDEKKIRRPEYPIGYYLCLRKSGSSSGFDFLDSGERYALKCSRDGHTIFDVEDLLAEDWEIL